MPRKASGLTSPHRAGAVGPGPILARRYGRPVRALTDDLILEGDNLEVIRDLPADAFDLVYLDPPFNTGRRRERRTVRATADPAATRVGFAGRRYRTEEVVGAGYDDAHDDYIGFLAPRLGEARRLLAPHGTLYLHLDPREAYRVRYLLLDEIFGADAFLSELVWAYDFGGRSRDRWPAKHDTILAYVRTPGRHFFDAEGIDRDPYMAPNLQTPERAARGKRPTDVIWQTIVPTTGREKTGYPTQKPEGLLRRLVQASSRPGGWCLDFFAGSGTLGAVCRALGRRYVLVDDSPEAVAVMRRRLGAPTRAGG
jgi:site-specific DNA-methyltransferase (adenine-specific)